MDYFLKVRTKWVNDLDDCITISLVNISILFASRVGVVMEDDDIDSFETFLTSKRKKGIARRFDSGDWPGNTFGGKGDNLRVLIKTLCLTVPPFFVLSSDFEDPVLLRQELVWLSSFGGCKLAVRSSGLQEDGDESALAGANLSLLNVDPANVWEAVLQVRRSSRTEAAIPVVVQMMRSPVFSGIAFSRHPVKGSNVVVVDVAVGLGEGVVGGAVDPCQLLFEKDSGELLSDSLILSGFESSAKELVCRVIEIERHYGKPMDVEFCVDGCGLWILQARPVTTVTELIAPKQLEQCLFANDHTKEVMGSVLTPLTFSAFRDIINTAMRARCSRLGFAGFAGNESYYELIHGRVYQNVNITFELYKQEFGSLINLEALKKEFSSIPSIVLDNHFENSKALFGPAVRVVKMVAGARTRLQELEKEVLDICDFYEKNCETCDFESALSRLTVFAASYIEVRKKTFFFVFLFLKFEI